MVKNDLSTGSLNRAFHASKIGFGIAGSYIGYQFQNLFLDPEAREQKRKEFHKKNGQRIRKELQFLRGPIMKLGQTLSMQTHLIPEETILELAELQMHAPPMHPTLMRTQFKKSMGKYPEELFAKFVINPFAAASLGQVHHAETHDGQNVAVKIQYPAIRKAMENDFKLLRSATFPIRLTNYITKEMLDEIERGILQEADYLNEARNIHFFRERLSELPYVRVPEVVEEYSSDKVLTMTCMQGEFLDQWLENNPTQETRDQMGTRLFELFSYQFFNINTVHADPHPGNYLYGKDNTISLVDFGCVKELPNSMMDYCYGFVDKIWEKSEKEYAQLLSSVFGKNFDPNDKNHKQVMDALIEYHEILMPTKNPDQTVDFGKPNVFERMFGLFDSVLKYEIPDPDFFFLSRAELGLCNTLFRLKARVRTTQIAVTICQKAKTAKQI